MHISISRKLAAFLLLLVLAVPVSQANSATQVRVSGEVSFDTAEGTAMNLDISPDGRTIVFDLLGDLYLLNAEGGQAVVVSAGSGWDSHPVWSPDGKRIAFISDRDGYDNIYVMRVGALASVHRVTKRDSSPGPSGKELRASALRTVEWMPDGLSLISEGVVYSVSSGERQSLPVPVPNWNDRIQTSARGNSLFYTNNKIDRSTVGAVGSRHDLLRYSFQSGQSNVTKFTPTEACATLPVVSPNEKYVIYQASSSGKKNPNCDEVAFGSLRIQNMETGRDSTIIDHVNAPGWSHWDYRGVPRRYLQRLVITPDSTSLLIAYGGRIHRINLESGENQIVPFKAQVRQFLAPVTSNKFRLDDNLINIKYMRSATISPDGKSVVFSALRRIYLMSLPNGEPKVLVDQDAGQFHPLFSPDGNWVAYATWSDTEGGAIWRAPVAGGKPEKLTISPGYYQNPTWSPDGKNIAFVAGEKTFDDSRSGFIATVEGGYLRVLSVDSRSVTNVAAKAMLGFQLGFSPDGKRLLFVPYQGDYARQMASVLLDGSDLRAETFSGLFPEVGSSATTALASPDGKFIAVVKFGNLFLVEVGRGDSKPRSIRVSSAGGNDPSWRDGGRILTWSFANRLYVSDVSKLAEELTRSDRHHVGESQFSLAPNDSLIDSFEINLSVPRFVARGVIALRGGRLVSMRGDEIVEESTIVVADGRIAAVGPAALVEIPEGASVMDVSGKTILPGFIDVHAHAGTFPRELLAGNWWEQLAILSYGVTSTRDPSVGGDHGFGYAELSDTGAMTSPRIFGGVSLLNVDVTLSKFQDAQDLARRYKALGSTFLKPHTGFSRKQREWLTKAANAEGMNLVSHNSDDNRFTFLSNLSVISDGATSSEHELSDVDVYQDVVKFVAQSGVWSVPAPINWGFKSALVGEAANDLRVQRFFLNPLKYHAPGEPELGSVDSLPALTENQASVARTTAAIVREGGNVAVGSHGDKDGVDFHWEVWAYVQGGMTRHQALRAATIEGALVIGVGQDLGSIEVGKIADLVILDKNPLDDIKNTVSTSYVMKSGEVYEAKTLKAVWPVARELPAWKPLPH